MTRTWRRSLVCTGAIGIAVATFLPGRGRAGGIPASGALTYSGLLQDAAGVELTGIQYIEVKFWNDGAASAAANVLCDTGTPTGIGLVSGRFSIVLPDECTSRVGANPQVWAEVLVGPTATAAASLGRAKLGVVPYAVEAQHAVNASSAATATGAMNAVDGGGIAAAIDSLSQSVSTLRGNGDPVTAFITVSANTATISGQIGGTWLAGAQWMGTGAVILTPAANFFSGGQQCVANATSPPALVVLPSVTVSAIQVATYGLRAYPSRPLARHAITPQAICSIAK